jgi:hypothetical protein
VALQCALESHTLAVGAQSKHRRRDAPRAFALRVRAGSLAGVVMAVQPARKIARLAGVGCGPAVRLEDVAAESRTAGRVCVMRSLGHSRVNSGGLIGKEILV